MATNTSPATNVPTISELRTKVRELLQNRETEFNVLVVGRPGSCKSTLINSMNMALAERWRELAEFGMGDSNNTLRLDKIPLFEDRFMEEKVEGYMAKVNFWDCAGIENVSDEAYGEFIGLTLDGKVPDKTTVFASVNKSDKQLMTVRELREEFDTVVEENRFHRLLLLCAADETVSENLLTLIKTTTSAHKNMGRNIPIFLAMSKADRIKDDQREYRKRKETAERLLNLGGNMQRSTELTLYHVAKEGEDGGCDVDVYGKFLQNEDIDKDLLILLINLLDPAFDRGLAYNENTDIEPEVEPEPSSEPTGLINKLATFWWKR
ncbi:Hypp6000 [Branchiostoma lanceolatum]|uniref:Hypp6000 protein n=1 Tax=Branchiostoma lanceolatum TaxID=7740 RepID=A0A8J9VJ71_BRALA|nr:Hypp6000 [Branchiostoma lanceolatum]